MFDPETKALLERLDGLKCNTEQIGAQSRAVIEKTKKTVNEIKRAEETEWPCDGSILGSYEPTPKV